MHNLYFRMSARSHVAATCDLVTNVEYQFANVFTNSNVAATFDLAGLYVFSRLYIFVGVLCPYNLHIISGKGVRTQHSGQSTATERVQTSLEQGSSHLFRYEAFDNYARNYGETTQHYGEDRDYRDANWTAVGYVRSIVPRSDLAVSPAHKPLWPVDGFAGDYGAELCRNIIAQGNTLENPTQSMFTRATGCRRVPFRPPGRSEPTKDAPLTFVPTELLDLNLAAQEPTLQVSLTNYSPTV